MSDNALIALGLFSALVATEREASIEKPPATPLFGDFAVSATGTSSSSSVSQNAPQPDIQW